MDLTDMYRVLYPIIAQYTLFSATHGTFSKTDHILGHKCIYKKTEITPCILSDHNTIKPELNNKTNNRKDSNTYRLKNKLLHDQSSLKK
jgi:hypothetical protein